MRASASACGGRERVPPGCGALTPPAPQVVLNAGDILYLPAWWFHYIISLETTIQCNTRSGSPPNGMQVRCAQHVHDAA